jgi:hypothetical protein
MVKRRKNRIVKDLSKEISKDIGSINRSLGNNFNTGVKRFDKNINKLDKELDKEVQQVERWVIERRKFFIKLGWVILLILVLFIISELYLTVKVAG